MKQNQPELSLKNIFKSRACASLRVTGLHLNNRGILCQDGFTGTFPAGKISWITAPNGSGKTSLLACLAGLLEPISGKVEILREDLNLHAQGDSLQQAAWISWLPPEDNFTIPQDPIEIAMAGRWRFHQGQPTAADIDAARTCMMVMGLPKDLRLPSTHLSSGQKRRLNLARVLCQDADILLLDEPFRGLDETGQAKISALLEWLADAGRTIIIADPR